jgi:hypothetical protein
MRENRMKLTALAVAIGIGATAALADQHAHDHAEGRTPAPAGASVYFVNLKDGATVSSPVTVVFGARGIGVAPAGVEKENTGHHHLLINLEPTEETLSEALPADDNHRHFGGGQTEATLALAPGTYTLQLLMADHNHVPHEPPLLSEKITITVK